MGFMCHMEGCETRMYCTDTRNKESSVERVYQCPTCNSRMKTEECATEMLDPGVDLRKGQDEERRVLEAFVNGEWVNASTRQYRPTTNQQRFALKNGQTIDIGGVQVRRKKEEVNDGRL